MNQLIELRLKHCTDLPSLPGIALRIIELSQEQEVDIGKLTALINQDPALAVKLLRVANSPLYARRRKCSNLRQAVAMLGLHATQSLALTFSLRQALSKKGANGMDYTLYWRRSVLAAVSGRVLALRQGAATIEEQFLAALLQDIGMLALDKAIPEIYSDVAGEQHDHQRLQAAELNLIGTDHAAVGAWLLQAWNMPSQYHRAVAGSHDTALTDSSDDEDSFIRNVSLTGHLADVWLHENRELALSNAATIAQDLLGIDKDALLAIIEEIAKELPEIESLFEIDLIDNRHVEEVLEQGRELLLIHNLQVMQHAVDIKQDLTSLQTQTRALEEENRRDSLTGLYNRAYLCQVLGEEFQHAAEQNWPLSVAFIDLDRFKHINDTYGHQAGDKVLMQVAKAMMDIARGSDIIARYGGEEFVMVLAGCNAASAARVCERIVSTVAAKGLDIGNGEAVSVTVSIGIATHHEVAEFESYEDLLRSADRALYTAKIQGRNRVVTYDPDVGALALQ